MVRYSVKVFGAAAQDIMDAALYLKNASDEAPYIFLDDLDQKVDTLSTLPNRYGVYEKTHYSGAWWRYTIIWFSIPWTKRQRLSSFTGC